MVVDHIEDARLSKDESARLKGDACQQQGKGLAPDHDEIPGPEKGVQGGTHLPTGEKRVREAQGSFWSRGKAQLAARGQALGEP